jgi:hypothetical protein
MRARFVGGALRVDSSEINTIHSLQIDRAAAAIGPAAGCWVLQVISDFVRDCQLCRHSADGHRLPR